ncbi:hypothetical protein EQW78_00620 [Oerskovia turbata]|uniref:Uncharacterized protein n=1 Tax=Oerskovia turbata TaxID=1713 RepID=A0A4V1N5S3_9CELL|nr:hypothetical protein [Oerskovia turbata]RXR26193.1 hypothetical protein EQW73_07565 [Oerskovia turbata]RXR36695.1 hypothetical protein EQW78_00620 [Oerskovia turbata]TGJ94489.1 hypothetical protein DLJ96_19415 [Actinotalea fermentans ATCC 43279 = JCM 9966 = DSM 3133]
MTTTAQYVADLQAQQRAVRHAASLPLLVTTLGVGFLAYCEIATEWWIFPQVLVPAVVFGALFVGMRVQRQVLGVGTGRDRYGLLALAVILLTLFPGPVLSIFVGASFFLGAGLVALGWRARDTWLWAPGLGLMVVSPLVTLGTLDNHAPFLGGREGGLIISTALLLLLTVAAFVRERHVVASVSTASA